MTEINRISVAVSEETAAALQHLVDREGITLTEAFRRLVGYGAFMKDAQDAGGEIVVHRPSWVTRLRRRVALRFNRWQVVRFL